jgi:hypothetical protein
MSANKYLPVMIGIGIGQGVLQCQRPLNGETWKKMILSETVWKMVILIVLIRIYGAFIEADLPGGGPLMDVIRMELSSYGIGTLPIIVFIPFISAVATGIAIGFIGASFPIVMSLIGPHPPHSVLYATVLLASASGFIGQILSPVHVCLIVTNEYFKTNLSISLLKLIKPCLWVVVGALGLYGAVLRLISPF